MPDLKYLKMDYSRIWKEGKDKNWWKMDLEMEIQFFLKYRQQNSECYKLYKPSVTANYLYNWRDHYFKAFKILMLCGEQQFVQLQVACILVC